MSEAGQSQSPGGAPRPLDFATYLMSLGTSALVQLGECPEPGTNESCPCDLAAARQTIDLLGLLEEKTQGNRDPKEDALLRGLLKDLRVRWVLAAKQKGASSPEGE